MSGHSLATTREIDASIDQVWDVLTDVDRYAEVLSGVRRVERVNGGPYGVGTRWRETRAMGGKEETQELHVTAVEPQRSTTIEARDGAMTYTTVFGLVPVTADRTRIDLSFTAAQADPSRGQRIVWGLLGRVGLAFTRRMLDRDLADIGRAAQSRTD